MASARSNYDNERGIFFIAALPIMLVVFLISIGLVYDFGKLNEEIQKTQIAADNACLAVIDKTVAESTTDADQITALLRNHFEHSVRDISKIAFEDDDTLGLTQSPPSHDASSATWDTWKAQSICQEDNATAFSYDTVAYKARINCTLKRKSFLMDLLNRVGFRYSTFNIKSACGIDNPLPNGPLVAVIAFDMSYSIGDSELSDLKNSLKEFIDKYIQNGDYFMLTTFTKYYNGGCREGDMNNASCSVEEFRPNVIVPMSKVGTSSDMTPGELEAGLTYYTKTDIKNQINRFRGRGATENLATDDIYTAIGTYMQGGIYLARKMVNYLVKVLNIDSTTRKAIIVFSDGFPIDSSFPPGPDSPLLAPLYDPGPYITASGETYDPYSSIETRTIDTNFRGDNNTLYSGGVGIVAPNGTLTGVARTNPHLDPNFTAASDTTYRCGNVGCTIAPTVPMYPTAQPLPNDVRAGSAITGNPWTMAANPWGLPVTGLHYGRLHTTSTPNNNGNDTELYLSETSATLHYSPRVTVPASAPPPPVFTTPGYPIGYINSIANPRAYPNYPIESVTLQNDGSLPLLRDARSAKNVFAIPPDRTKPIYHSATGVLNSTAVEFDNCNRDKNRSVYLAGTSPVNRGMGRTTSGGKYTGTISPLPYLAADTDCIGTVAGVNWDTRLPLVPRPVSLDLQLHFQSRSCSNGPKSARPLSVHQADLARRENIHIFSVCTFCSDNVAQGLPYANMRFMRRMASDRSHPIWKDGTVDTSSPGLPVDYLPPNSNWQQRILPIPGAEGNACGGYDNAFWDPGLTWTQTELDVFTYQKQESAHPSVLRPDDRTPHKIGVGNINYNPLIKAGKRYINLRRKSLVNYVPLDGSDNWEDLAEDFDELGSALNSLRGDQGGRLVAY